MVRVGIIGCGKIADSHLSQVQRIADCKVVAACDREELMARQLCDRFAIEGCFSDVSKMLADARPDVVHITTPPQSHFPLAKQCLERGIHVYVEKPFTVITDQAEELIAMAERLGLKLTVGHDDQFSHAARHLRRLVADGWLGGKPVHLESTYCYELSGSYAKALLGDAQHWVRQLPGGLLHNVISHGIARIAEYLTGESTTIAHGFTSAFLRGLGEARIIDELRVIIRDASDTTAYFTFSSQMRPALHSFAIYGPKNGLALDEDQQIVLKLRGERRKSYAEKFVPPVEFARQHLGNLSRNLRTFLRRDFHMKSGMKHLAEEFYRSIREGGPVPIPYPEILQTSRIMDAIFSQIGASETKRVTPRLEAVAASVAQ